ncbi:MAG: hypothetical protein HYY93_15475 [Planctomycetes bacterium]|nr:hypothetical protein [Planctomycetota bacterium]
MRHIRCLALSLAAAVLVPWVAGACSRPSPRPPADGREASPAATVITWRYRGLEGLEEAVVEARQSGRRILVGVSGGPG